MDNGGLQYGCRVLRGGVYFDANPVSGRCNYYPTYGYDTFIQAHTLHKVTLNANSDQTVIGSV